MALTVLALSIPVGNGVGAASDAHLLDAQKSFVLDGTIGATERLVIESTCDPAGLVGWTGVFAWTNSNPGDITIRHIAYWYRVRRAFAAGGTSPTASVAATADGTNTFFTLAVPTSGVGVAVDVSAGGRSMSLTLDGSFGQGEVLALEGSQDNISWNGIRAFNSNNPGPVFLPTSYKYLRIDRALQVSPGSAMQVFLGTANAGSGGGGTIASIASADASIAVTNPGGPNVDLSAALKAVTSTGGTVIITGAGSTKNLEVPAQFGPDTIVPLPGDALALELILTAAAHVSRWTVKTLTAAATQAIMGIFGSVGGSPGFHMPEGSLLGLKDDGATGLLYTLAGGIRMFILGNQKFQLSPTGAIVTTGSAPGIGNSTGGNFTLTGSTVFANRQISSGQGTTSFPGPGLLRCDNLLGNNFLAVLGSSPTDYLATTNWGPSSRVTISLPAGYTVNHASGAPPVSYAPILLRAGVNLVTAAPYMLDLVFDGTNWVQPG